MNIFKKILTISLIAVLSISQTACSINPNSKNVGFTKESFYFDTICDITLYGMAGLSDEYDDDEYKNIFISKCFERCADYENILSKTKENSDIQKINKGGTSWTIVNEHTANLVEKALKYSELSNGAFDISIGKASDLWDFHGEASEGKMPDKEELNEAVNHIDYTKIVCDAPNHEVKLLDPDMEIDLGGIAKGYIADEISSLLRDLGVTSAIINFGGNIVAIGGKANKFTEEESSYEDFKIGIRNPLSESGELLGYMPGKNITVVTSGTYERYVEVDGVKYHHILNPKTGYPFETDLIQVSIIMDEGMSADADAISTTCLALGKDEGIKYIEKLSKDMNIEAIFLDKDGNITYSNENSKFVEN